MVEFLDWVYLGLFFMSGVLITRLILPGLINLIIKAQFVRPNYRGELIPNSVGLVFFLTSLITGVFFIIVNFKFYLIFLFTISSFACLGLIDDIWGMRDILGLAGHLKSLLKGKLTTGALKALGGLAVAFVVSAAIGSREWIFVNALVIALSANAINLLDLRPGRAGKGFILLAIAITGLGWSQRELFFLITLLGSVVAYLKVDLEAKAMMGDAGSNVLGGVAGVSAVLTLSQSYLIVYLVLLILFHLLTERYSLTKIIAVSPFLNFLDRLGRK